MNARYDVVVLSATPAGIMAAIAAAQRGCTVVVLERSAHVGGLPANGLGATDIQTRGATAGLFLTFVQRVRSYYVERYGADSPQAQECNGGYLFEPSVAEHVLAAMLSEHPQIVVRTQVQFDAHRGNVRMEGMRVVALQVQDRILGQIEWISGGVLIDASYEGDLASAAGAPFRLGRESAEEFKEPMAGVLYAGWREKPAAGSTGQADEAIQAYNYRLCLTNRPENRAPIQRPATYQRDEYVSLLDDLAADRWTGRAGNELELQGIGRVVNLVRLPNDKYDANNQHLAFISTDLPVENQPWPTADWSWRDAFAVRLRDYTLGLLWFCQHDDGLPEDFRLRCLAWGLAADEYLDNGHFPRQVYVREARRIQGRYLFTAHDTLPAREGARPPVHRDSVTASHYPLDSHAVRKREVGRPHLEGFFNLMNVPYTVPYGVMVPEGVGGLLVPVAASTTHVGYSSLRMEPCWMALGEAAGVAAALAREEGVAPEDLEIERVQRELLARGAVLIYFNDLAVCDPLAALMQQLALRGEFQGWEAHLDEVVDGESAERWQYGLSICMPSQPDETRRDYLARLAAGRERGASRKSR